MKQNLRTNIVEALLHLGAWMLVFVSPLLFARDVSNEGLEISYLSVFFPHITVVTLFYFNYCQLVPRLLFKQKALVFGLLNIALIASMAFSTFMVRQAFPPHPHFKQEQVAPIPQDMPQNGIPKWEDEERPRFEGGSFDRPAPANPDGFPKVPNHKIKGALHIFHHILFLFLACCISALLKYTKKWFRTMADMKDLEKGKMEVELKNLKSQLNPHFLFNTLNNIYTLIGINQDRAQQAVIDLSKLLRYALYEGEQQFVTLGKEVDFINNYVKLMNLRLANTVSVTSNLNIGTYGNQPVAQMLFITLVENAFKHGVSNSQPSFIDMQMEVTDCKEVFFRIANSRYPKGDKDKSGSGIGIENLKRRLELLYASRYTYNVTDDGHTYTATLTIKLND